MSGLSKLGTALSVVFAVSLAALVAELFYVLWRRRVFRRQIVAGDSGDSFSTSASSKELLYFLCWKHQSRVEPDGGGATQTTRDDGSSSDSPEEEIDVLKLQGMYGPSRVLFTIKEDEREDDESEKSLSLSFAENVPEKTKRRVSLEECFRVIRDSPEVALTVEADILQTTPFSTPCASPLYYTPSASPVQESSGGLSTGVV